MASSLFSTAPTEPPPPSRRSSSLTSAAAIQLTHATPDGRNINADCGALHPEIVAAETKAGNADIGVTFDGDADRALFADAHGNVVNGDAILLLAARDLKARNLAERQHRRRHDHVQHGS